jgi:hypothetical protein
VVDNVPSKPDEIEVSFNQWAPMQAKIERRDAENARRMGQSRRNTGGQMTPQEIIKAILAALTAGVDVSLQFDGITIGEIEVKALVVTVRAGKGNDAQQGGK